MEESLLPVSSLDCGSDATANGSPYQKAAAFVDLVIFLLIWVEDIVVYIIFLANDYYLPFRIAPYLRVVFLILNNRELRENFLILAGMLGAYLNVVVCFHCLWGLMTQGWEKPRLLHMAPRYTKCFFYLLHQTIQMSDSCIQNNGFIDRDQFILLLEELNKYRSFGGIVNTGNPDLNQTDLARYDYLLFNFNDYLTGMVTVFNLLVMGIWPLVMQNYKELTGTSWTYVYFFSFYLVVILWLLNLIIVFVLEAFRVENEDEDKEERRELRHTVGAKNRRQKLDALHRRLCRERTRPCNP